MTKESSVEVVLLPEDDAMHAVEEAANFNESAYYNFFDRMTRTGGWVRIGNRPNEGYAEMTVCFYEPDGSAAFMWKKPEIHDNRAHDAGGLRFEVVEPLEGASRHLPRRRLRDEESARHGGPEGGLSRQPASEGRARHPLARALARLGRRAAPAPR